MPPLVGRDPELATIDRFLRSVGEGYQAVVFRGGAGYGKSALLEETVARARDAGFRALTARPAETEAELPFGVLAELLEPVGMSELDLPAPRRARWTSRCAGSTRTKHVRSTRLGSASRWSRRFASWRRSSRCSSRSTTCSGATRRHSRTLEFALRRVESEQIGLAVGLRSGDGLEIQVPAANGHLTAVEVGPLDAEAFETVVRRGQSTSQTGSSAAPRGVRREPAVRQGGGGAARRARAPRRPGRADSGPTVRLRRNRQACREARPRHTRCPPRGGGASQAHRRRPARGVRGAEARGRARGGGGSWDRGRRPRASPLHPSARRGGGLRGRHAGSSSRRTRRARTSARPPGGTGAAARACHHPGQRRRRGGARVGRRGRRRRAARSTPRAGCWSRRSTDHACPRQRRAKASRPRGRTLPPRGGRHRARPQPARPARSSSRSPGEELAEVLLELALADGSYSQRGFATTRTLRSRTRSRARRSQIRIHYCLDGPSRLRRRG